MAHFNTDSMSLDELLGVAFTPLQVRAMRRLMAEQRALPSSPMSLSEPVDQGRKRKRDTESMATPTSAHPMPIPEPHHEINDAADDEGGTSQMRFPPGMK